MSMMREDERMHASRRCRTAIYKRVSTTKQSQKDSPEHQEGICREKARQLQLSVDDHYIYEDRDSAINIVGRPAIQRMILDAQQGRFDVILFASLSRFSRDTMDSLALKRMLVDSLGLRLISLDEGFDSELDKDELKFQIISAVNQKLSEQISVSSKRGIRQSALKGNFTGSIPPYGYVKTKDGELNTLIPVEPAAEVVRLIFRLYTAHGLGEKAIVRHLNEQLRIPSPKGSQWGITTIQRLLQNEAYTGVTVFGKYESRLVYANLHDLSDRKKKLIPRPKSLWEKPLCGQTHEPLIDRATFALAGQIRERRGKGRRGGVRARKNVFAGFIRCCHCGSAFVSVKSTSSGASGEYRYLVCSKRRRQGAAGCANNYRLPYASFRDDLLGLLSRDLKKTAGMNELTDPYRTWLQERTARQRDETPSIRRKIERQIELYRSLLFELKRDLAQEKLDDAQFYYERQRCEQELRLLEGQLQQAELQQAGNAAELETAGIDFCNELRREVERLLNLDLHPETEFERLRSILTDLIASIRVSADGNVDITTAFSSPQLL